MDTIFNACVAVGLILVTVGLGVAIGTMIRLVIKMMKEL